jgi:hypothetical protein
MLASSILLKVGGLLKFFGRLRICRFGLLLLGRPHELFLLEHFEFFQ